ncbi:MAG: hypothetical protein H0V42_02295 [Nocardioidaceae bacterium]|nr:hypothetical protein [Nocardioidaceae bacterium]
MKLRALTCAAGLAVGTVATIGIANAGQDANTALLQDVRAATSRYHSPAQAERDGYVKDSPCETSPAGGMGFHYVNFSKIGDPTIDPSHPEVLLYAPGPSGRVQLVGVEYFKIDADGSLLTANDRPFLGDVPFNGPMPGHTAQMPIHYDLHVWLYEENSSGMFAPWNPAVSC